MIQIYGKILLIFALQNFEEKHPIENVRLCIELKLRERKIWIVKQWIHLAWLFQQYVII